MKYVASLLAALPLLFGCGSAIEPNQADGNDCNLVEGAAACGAASFCDAGEPKNGVFPRTRKYGLTGDKMHVVGTCRPKGGAGAACMGAEYCKSGKCMHAATEPPGAKGVCE